MKTLQFSKLWLISDAKEKSRGPGFEHRPWGLERLAALVKPLRNRNYSATLWSNRAEQPRRCVRLVLKALHNVRRRLSRMQCAVSSRRLWRGQTLVSEAPKCPALWVCKVRSLAFPACSNKNNLLRKRRHSLRQQHNLECRRRNFAPN